MSASPNGPCPYPGELSVTVYSSSNSVTSHFLLHVFFPDQHFSIPVTPSPLLCALGHSGTTLGLPSILEALATTSHPPAEFPFWATPSIHTTPPWVATVISPHIGMLFVGE